MKKILVFALLLTCTFVFSTTKVSAFTISHNSDYIQMVSPVTIDDEEVYLVQGKINGSGSSGHSEIEMDMEYSKILIDVMYKDNSVEVKYILEVQSQSYPYGWSEVETINSTATSGTVTMYTTIYNGYDYRLKIENVPSFWNNYDTDIQVKWRANIVITY